MDGVDALITLLSSANPLSLTLVFVYGTLIGSFVNVCIGRMPVEKSIVWPGSACTSCGVPLQWWQNLPIVSYLALGARCHYCGSPLSIRYLLLEVLTGAVAVAVFWSTHTVGFVAAHGVALATYAFCYYFVFSCLLIIVFFVDLDAWIILDPVNYFGIAVGIVGAWLMPPQFMVLQYGGWDVQAWAGRATGGWANALWSVAGACLGYGMFLGIALLGSALARQEAMGRGDVKFAALIGAFLGPQKGFAALLLSFPLGALVALPLIFLRGKSGKTPIPFGTFMAVAAFAVAVLGDGLVRWFPFPV
jgi:leader peptidase (prepilin peptidase)/N-methyltransferase